MLAASPVACPVDGSARMRERPMEGLLQALRAQSADIVCRGADDMSPCEIRGARLRGGEIRLARRPSSRFISALLLAAWHLFDDAALRADFLAGDEARQFAILNEILRLEPIASLLYRRKTHSADKGDEKYALDLRAIHEDEAAVGPCPRALDPDRAQRMKTNGAFLSFGAGAHHCPGKQVALHETRMFLDALLRVPGIRLERAPDVGWSEMLLSYELRDAVVTCDHA